MKECESAMKHNSKKERIEKAKKEMVGTQNRLLTKS
jgi:hypothetical protein